MKKDWFFIAIIAAFLVAAVLYAATKKPCPEQVCPACPEQICPACPSQVCPVDAWLDAWEKVEREKEVKKSAAPGIEFQYHACYPYLGNANRFSGICTKIIHIRRK